MPQKQILSVEEKVEIIRACLSNSISVKEAVTSFGISCFRAKGIPFSRIICPGKY